MHKHKKEVPGSINFSQWTTWERNPFFLCSVLFSSLIQDFVVIFKMWFPIVSKAESHLHNSQKKKSTDLTMNIFYATEKNNSVKKQLPRTHLTLSPSRTRSLLSPPLCHKQVSVWTWTLNWNKHNSFIKSDFTNLIGSNKATEKGQVTFQFDFMVEVSRRDHKHTKT